MVSLSTSLWSATGCSSASKYGRILDIDLKIPPRPPRYAVVEFEDPHDADDAIYGRDEYNFDGYMLLLIVAEASLILMIVQAAISVHAVEVFLGALISMLWSLVYPHRYRGKT